MWTNLRSEKALRTLQRATAGSSDYSNLRQHNFLARSPQIKKYNNLSILNHVYISTCLPPMTPTLLHLVEKYCFQNPFTFDLEKLFRFQRNRSQTQLVSRAFDNFHVFLSGWGFFFYNSSHDYHFLPCLFRITSMFIKKMQQCTYLNLYSKFI